MMDGAQRNYEIPKTFTVERPVIGVAAQQVQCQSGGWFLQIS